MSARLFEAMRKDAPVQAVIAAMTAESTAKSDSPPPSAEPAPSASSPPKKHGKARTHVAQPTPLAVHAADQSICD
ncbi:MAG: hypothetical protein JF587_21260 [Catenulisporales bacterium]|nr:hypothetical protein [Catenulisporales bacterium]